MTLEETALSISMGGGFTIVGVVLGWWLTTRETRRERRDRENAFKRLIVAEVAGSLSTYRIMSWVVEMMTITGSRPEPRSVLDEIMTVPVSSMVYDAIARDPTVVPPDVFEKIMPWREAVTLSHRLRAAWLVGSELQRPSARLSELVNDTTRAVEVTGLALLKHLGATQEINDHGTLKKEFLDPIIELARQAAKSKADNSD